MKRFQMSTFLKSIPVTSSEPPPARQRKPRKKKEERPKVQEKPKPKPIPYKKKKIPVALREQVWIKQMGKVFHGKCPTTWCQNTISVFDFQSGHNIPESKGGPTNLENLIPLCSRCNLSMGNDYTFDQWCKISDQPPATVEVVAPKQSWCCSFFSLK
jgi:5-methylcytosine-specific restriction endonuclease McrA